MTEQRKKPADVVIEAFGGIHATARALSKEVGRDVRASTVSSWLHRTGNVPHRWHRPAINAARTRGVKITLEDLEYLEQ